MTSPYRLAGNVKSSFSGRIEIISALSLTGATLNSTSFESFRSETPAWDVLIDLDELAAKECEDWVWRDDVTLPPAHDRAIIHLSRGGSDATVLREFVLSSREFRQFHRGVARSAHVLRLFAWQARVADKLSDLEDAVSA